MSVDLTLRRAVTPRSISSSVRTAIARTMRRSDDQPVWYRPGLAALLVGTGVLYIWGLGASGWANGFYSAAVQAGSSSWKAWFFGSFDASNAITVDKPPAALWVMGLSARVFGVNAWSILVPQALMGVGTVAALVATVKRWFRPGFALLAGAIVATTPVAALMFRFNNPDALLVLLLTVGAYAMTRAVEDGRTRWLVLAATLVGFGFLTKMLQAFVVLPAFGLVYLIAGPGTIWRRMRQGVVMAAVTFAAAGWWVAVVELWPKSSRPYIGGSTDNSVLELIFGYNGFGRLTGNERGSVGGGANGGGGNWGPTGWLRMFNDSFGGQISWLLPAALVLLVAGLAITARRSRTDRGRAALVMWGGWLLITGIVFSLGQGIIHEYYTVALAPAIGATVAIGAALLWDHRGHWWGRSMLAAPIVLTTWWTLELLDRSPGWNTWLRPTVVVLAILAVAGLAAWHLPNRAVRAVGIAAAIGAGLLVPTAASVATAATPHDGSIPLASPTTTGGRFGGRGAMPGRTGTQGGGTTGTPPTGRTGTLPAAPTGGQAPAGRTGGTGGVGGLLSTSSASDEVVAALTENADQYRWVLATVGANQAAGYQLATDEPVMAIGGFNGTDPSPTLEQFQQYVADGAIHYFTTGGTGGRSESSSAITTWVEQNFTPVTIGGLTLYDLTEGAA